MRVGWGGWLALGRGVGLGLVRVGYRGVCRGAHDFCPH